MRTRTSCVVGVALSIALLVASAAAQFANGQFSADVELNAPGRAPVGGRIYFGDRKLRFDVAGSNRIGGMIFDLQNNVSYVLMPQLTAYIEVKGTQSDQLRLSDIRPSNGVNPCVGYSVCRKMGTEVIGNRTCDNWEYGNGTQLRVACLDRRIRVYIRSKSTDGRTMQLVNIREGIQPDRLFSVPESYHRLQAQQGR